ncbi:MAG: hypothetical protein LAT68_03075 [Cyclobacteriaceae bacterium]|nr:hypothetical protein [Cyclobacteriaceae bacterium]MCH8515289.1 hypothetical protein [Cyclobacteriaceae bacterium]
MLNFLELNKKISQFSEGTSKNQEIKVSELVSIFTSGKRLILSSLILFFTIGLIKALSSPEEFTSVSKVITDYNPNQGFGGLSGIPGLSGLGGAGATRGDSEFITPDIYPQIVGNDQFLLDIAQQEFYFKDLDKEMNLITFFSEHEEKDLIAQLLGFPGFLFRSIFSSKSAGDIKVYEGLSEPGTEDFGQKLVRITKKEKLALIRLENRIKVDKSNRILEISTKMPDDEVATILNKKVIESLIDYVIAFNTDRERSNLEFITQQTKEAKTNFEEAQNKLAYFRDSNMGIVSQRAKSQEQRFQSNYELTFQVYNNLAQQLERSKLKLQEAKPVLTIFQKPYVPLSPSEPNYFLTLIIFSILGLFLGVGFIGFLVIRSFLLHIY